MPEEDQPSELIYGHDRKLKEHFEFIKARRKERYKRPGADEELEDVPQTDNEYTAAVKEKLGLK